MARSLRISYEGAWYHIMNRGAGRRNIFLSSKNRSDFLALLNDIHTRFQVQTHAYCLMDNHYHILLHTPKSNISRAIRHLNGVYTQKFNYHNCTDGPLFRGRFKSILVEKDCYLIRLSRYIHLNPVEAKMVNTPEQFLWSSYKAYLNLDEKPEWLYRDEVLSHFDSFDNTSSRINYRDYVEDKKPDVELDYFFSQKKPGCILGSETFKKSMLKNVQTFNFPDMPQTRKFAQMKCPSIETIIDVTAKHYSLSSQKLRSAHPRSTFWPRQVAIYLCALYSEQQYAVIAKNFERASKNSVAQTLHRVKKAVNNSESLCCEIAHIEHVLFLAAESMS